MDSKREGSKSVLLAIVSSGPSKITAKKYLLKDYNKSHPHSDISQIYTANLVLPPNHHLQDLRCFTIINEWITIIITFLKFGHVAIQQLFQALCHALGIRW